MDQIRQLFESLSSFELRHLKCFLHAFHLKGVNKALEFIKILEKDRSISNEEMGTRLYGKSSSKAYLMLKSRLLDRMKESLTLSSNLQKHLEQKDDNAEIIPLLIDRLIHQAIALKLRGLYELAADTLKKALKLLEKCDKAELRLRILLELQSISNNYSEIKDELSPKISIALEQFHVEMLAERYISDARLKWIYHSEYGEERLEWLELSSAHLWDRLEESFSPKAYYQYLNLQLMQCDQQRSYQEGREIVEELLHLKNTYPDIISREMHGRIYLNLAKTELLGYQFNHAYEAALQAVEMIPVERSIYLSAAVCLIYCCIYSGYIEESFELLYRLKTLKILHKQEFSRDLCNYLHSCTFLLFDEPKEAYTQFLNISSLNENKSGWNAGLRIHEIILLLADQKEDLVSPRIDSLRKHIARYGVSERLNTTYKFLYEWEKTGFQGNKINDDLISSLLQLEYTDPWYPYSFEVIKFDVWVLTKRSGAALYPGYISDLTRLSSNHEAIDAGAGL